MRSSSTESEDDEAGPSFLSDESSFYGDGELTEEYDARTASFDPTDYWRSREHDLQYIAEKARQRTRDKNDRKEYHERHLKYGQGVKQAVTPGNRTLPEETWAGTPMELDTEPAANEPFNPWEGDQMAKQLGETLETFLARLLPSTTTVDSGPWIWIANPSSSQRPLQSDVAGFKTSGTELMEEFVNRKAKLEAQNPGKPPAFITRILKADREWLEKSIIDLAQSKGVTNGKWMLFLYSSVVDEVWRKVAKATLEGTLGCAAKVATHDGSGSLRLICVYTEDFTDEEDVRRVLGKMQELHLIKGEQGIYYKCDAYTNLNIMSGNDYKLKVSMYSSKAMLKDAPATKQ